MPLWTNTPTPHCNWLSACSSFSLHNYWFSFRLRNRLCVTWRTITSFSFWWVGEVETEKKSPKIWKPCISVQVLWATYIGAKKWLHLQPHLPSTTLYVHSMGAVLHLCGTEYFLPSSFWLIFRILAHTMERVAFWQWSTVLSIHASTTAVNCSEVWVCTMNPDVSHLAIHCMHLLYIACCCEMLQANRPIPQRSVSHLCALKMIIARQWRSYWCILLGVSLVVGG